MFTKILVANRGEIAVRAFRAATELGIKTVAVFPYEDRNSEYRLKADESYEIGELGHPVRAYLDIEGIIAAAKNAGAQAIYPGYGFLSENPDLAERCEQEGITFVGPPHTVLELTGNKSRAIAAAKAAGLLRRPVVPMPLAADGLVRRGFRLANMAELPIGQAEQLAFGRVLDTTRMRAVLGFEPAYSTREAFDDFAARAGLTVPGIDLGLSALRRSQALVGAVRDITGRAR